MHFRHITLSQPHSYLHCVMPRYRLVGINPTSSHLASDQADHISYADNIPLCTSTMTGLQKLINLVKM